MSKLTANRLALVAAFLASLATGAAGVANTIPGQTGQAILIIAGMIGAVATAVTFAVGSQKFDATPVGQASAAAKLELLAPAAAKVAPVVSTADEIAKVVGDRVEAVLMSARAAKTTDPALAGFGESPAAGGTA